MLPKINDNLFFNFHRRFKKSICYLSKVVTRAEILVGVEDHDKDKVIAFLDQYAVLPMDKNIAELAAGLRKMHGWKIPDAFQAALALHHNLKLCTRKSKDFNPKNHPFIEIPY